MTTDTADHEARYVHVPSLIVAVSLTAAVAAVVIVADLDKVWFFVALVPVLAIAVAVQVGTVARFTRAGVARLVMAQEIFSRALDSLGSDYLLTTDKYSDEVVIGRQVALIRNPLAPALLPFVTFGVYTFVWYFRVNKELADMGKVRNTDKLGTSAGTSLLAITLGWALLIPPFVSLHNTWKRKAAAERMSGLRSGAEPALGVLITVLLPPIGFYIFQRDLNNVLRQALKPGGSLPPAPPAPQIEQPAQPTDDSD
jgi:uncharacterized protein DUF4234